MDLEFSIVSDILFIRKHKNDHNFGPRSNLDIDKILSVLDMSFSRSQNPAGAVDGGLNRRNTNSFFNIQIIKCKRTTI